jgi:predicted signal transduction protein with EAL and GGDEF domain
MSLNKNFELEKAQYTALSRAIPLLYVILLSNGFVLSAMFVGKAPSSVSIYAPLMLGAVCVLRFAMWWRRKRSPLADDRIVEELQRTNIVAALLGVAFCAWCFALFFYGDTYERAHIAFSLAISTLGSMLCLIHLRSAAFINTGIGGAVSIAFFAATGNSALAVTGINLLVVTVALSVVTLLQSRDFARLINAQTEARRREREQSRLLHMIDDMRSP